MIPKLINRTVTGRKDVRYYFFQLLDKDKALEEARKFRKPVAQCFDSWSVYMRIHRPGEIVSVHGQKFRSPSMGLILKFEHGSCG